MAYVSSVYRMAPSPTSHTPEERRMRLERRLLLLIKTLGPIEVARRLREAPQDDLRDHILDVTYKLCARMGV